MRVTITFHISTNISAALTGQRGPKKPRGLESRPTADIGGRRGRPSTTCAPTKLRGRLGGAVPHTIRTPSGPRVSRVTRCCRGRRKSRGCSDRDVHSRNRSLAERCMPKPFPLGRACPRDTRAGLRGALRHCSLLHPPPHRTSAVGCFLCSCN